MQSDVIIIGGGLVGMTLALALDAHGLSSAVVDAADLDATLALGFDGRATAIASASAAMFHAIGLGKVLDEQSCPIHRIRVSDGITTKPLIFDALATDGPDASGGGALGHMVENRHLRAALLNGGRAAAGIALHAPATAMSIVRAEHGVTVTLADGTVLTAPLLIAADGRRSKIRDGAGIAVARWTYPQTAIVTMIEHAEPHGGTAFELFYPTGPFAILPMQDTQSGAHRSAIVWTVENDAAAGTMKLGLRGLAAEIEARIGGLLGAVTVVAPAASYPLGYHHAATYTADRLVLIGDAAHGIHPIAGQGLNMGLRDVAALTEVLVDSARLGLDLGAPAVTARYSAWRRLDNSMVGSVTDGLNRLFALKGRVPAAARRFGLAAVERVPLLKRRFMAEARGETGDRPKLLTGTAL
ncbi:UbiH/UbiF/VisC/COQ6 family ubiquinone biosynthesis hydroxylase [Polymorphobacter sp. PAMC 29334]|uniref:UbiH/UbiF/VisC/COQ6 family ubiquinone biosynthesis hydroxylase n=1 Tax=Polymorphobacter sp. PAMC 29334 TaxID=2862331 RepID=UPI001C6676D0|nr:UbiH/UbiF/VisC/COQ6 family ubiquinone biosynthesis hydroxylase [Polymorphobacter sp. PAMC 29334]QYE35790.1 UbiH/UbiF/VisC/COQ6 family ubiquinone biosynthesis hydroxylase [Polymorphobacter sp. PAMC 29334]